MIPSIRRGRPVARVGAAAMLLAAMATGTAMAHSLSVAHVDVQTRADGSGVEVEVDVSLRDLALSLPLDRNGDDRITWGELQASEPDIGRLLSEGLRLSDAAGACPLDVERLGVRDYDDGTYASLRLHGRCGVGEIKLDYALLFAQDPQHRALVTFRKGAEVPRTAILTQGARTATMEGAAGHPFPTFVREGWQHILAGYDHLAFLLCLLLPAALTRSGGHWLPRPSARAGLWQAVGLATAFTLAHSITLSLAALGWVTPASKWVEAGIAASILLAALNLVWPVVHRKLWVATFVFGLVHGFGFAGALLEVGLPSQSRLLALVGFNVGVELGQLAAVLLVFPLLLRVRHQSWYVRGLLPGMAVVIAALASYWLFERLSG